MVGASMPHAYSSSWSIDPLTVLPALLPQVAISKPFDSI
jgi:hypothetical protein